MSISYVQDLELKTKKIQDNERFMVKVNGNDIKAVELRQKQLEIEKYNILSDLQIRMYELTIREKTLSDIYDELTGDRT